MKRRLLLVFSMVLLLTLGISACGAKGGGGSSGGAHNAGDAVTVADKNLVITMESGSISSYKVTATFTIENKGTTEFAIDTGTTFQVTATAGTETVPVSLDKPNCAKLIKGPVPAGGKVTGDLCWRGDPTKTWPSDAVISFGGAATDPGAVTWKVSAPK